MRHARANRRKRREQLALTDAHDRLCLAFWCVGAALVLMIAFIWLRLAAPALRMAGELAAGPAAVEWAPPSPAIAGARP